MDRASLIDKSPEPIHAMLFRRAFSRIEGCLHQHDFDQAAYAAQAVKASC
jgi:hypothetical protein